MLLRFAKTLSAGLSSPQNNLKLIFLHLPFWFFHRLWYPNSRLKNQFLAYLLGQHNAKYLKSPDLTSSYEWIKGRLCSSVFYSRFYCFFPSFLSVQFSHLWWQFLKFLRIYSFLHISAPGSLWSVQLPVSEKLSSKFPTCLHQIPFFYMKLLPLLWPNF